MSLILDALNRSRQDVEQVPGLSSTHPVDGAVAGINWMQWLLVSALAVAVLAIGWLLFDRLPQAPSVVDAPAAVTVLPERPTKPMPVQASGDVPDTGWAEAPVAAVLPAPSARVVPQQRQPAETSAREGLVEPPRAPIDAGVAALYQQQIPALAEAPAADEYRALRAASVQAQADKPANVSREEVLVDIEGLARRAQAEVEDARLAEHEAPFLSALSQQTKDAIPTLLYLRHDYSGDPARSSVVINGKAMRSGGSVGEVKVEEILPDSVVLSVRGTRFRLRALNSWVNL